ncbi:uncharacterized protein LOC130740088 isoform X3 [Lotus japonicus]|uniref:uncharacterized protein LOC130721964 isoform X3 n=1 Tax=Lotus japonicus TaxID=34305 RepID=UPI00258D8C7A|nr:uncharacterized protein LOC130721964 isoform X3 [Lotus japonicus]XP_057448572.1 uncharacterized protein LOC130740088 isoform X3 [Lotus japonicus]
MTSTSSSQVPSAVSLLKPIEVEGRTFVPEPPNEEEKIKIWNSQVLIPFSIGDKLHAYLGPYQTTFPRNASAFFPSPLPDEKILAFRDSYNLSFLGDPPRAFRSSPPVKTNPYIEWLNKVEKVKGDFWKTLGIFDIIQLSRSKIVYHPAMLASSFFFWERSTNTFHTPQGMITPTLLDVAAIAGLRPTGSSFTFDRPVKKEIKLDYNHLTYKSFILRNHDKTSANVSDSEHVAFLLFWLSAFFLCSKSLQVPQKFVLLAQLLHEGTDVCLGKVLLGELYLSLSQAITSLQKPSGAEKNILFAGPLWFLQLWLNAIFETKLSTPSPQNVSTSIAAFRLNCLTPSKDKVDPETTFREFFTAFMEMTSFTPDLAPFAAPTTGPKWLVRPFPCESPGEQLESISIWREFFRPQVLPLGFKKSEVNVLGYQPQLVARQFGLCQIVPIPLFSKKDAICNEGFCDKDVDSFYEALNYYDKKTSALRLEPLSFEPSFYCTKEFEVWWSTYYKSIQTTLGVCIGKMTEALQSVQKKATKKTRAEPIPKVPCKEDEGSDNSTGIPVQQKNVPKARKRGSQSSTSDARKKIRISSEKDDSERTLVDPIPEDENISSKTVDPDEAAQDNANSKASDINEENPPISSAKKRAGAEPNQEEQQAETDQEDSGSSQSESSGASSPTKTQQEQDNSSQPKPPPQVIHLSSNSSDSSSSDCQSLDDFLNFQPLRIQYPSGRIVSYVSSDNESFTQDLGASAEKSDTDEDRQPIPSPIAKVSKTQEKALEVSSPVAGKKSPQSIPIEDFDALAMDDPVLALEQLISGQVSLSTSRSQESSMQNEGTSTLNTATTMINKLRSLTFEQDLFSALNSNPNLGREIKQLIADLGNEDLTDQQEKGIQELQEFLDESLSTLDQAKLVGQDLASKFTECTQAAESFDQAKTEVDSIKLLEEADSMQLNEILKQIAELQQQEKSLKANLAKFKKQKTEVAAKAISHVKDKNRLEGEISELQNKKAKVDKRLKKLKGRYAPMKATPPF